MTDIVTDALAEGLKPSDAIACRDLALIGIDSKLRRIEKLHERTARAAEDQAAAMQALVALFASCIGRSSAWCPGEPDSSPAVNYLRTGDGRNFKCDVAEGDDDE